jgi:hypothetical protein
MKIELTHFLDRECSRTQLWGRVPPHTTDLSPFGRAICPRRLRQRASGVTSISTTGSLMPWELKHGVS